MAPILGTDGGVCSLNSSNGGGASDDSSSACSGAGMKQHLAANDVTGASSLQLQHNLVMSAAALDYGNAAAGGVDPQLFQQYHNQVSSRTNPVTPFPSPPLSTSTGAPINKPPRTAQVGARRKFK